MSLGARKTVSLGNRQFLSQSVDREGVLTQPLSNDECTSKTKRGQNISLPSGLEVSEISLFFSHSDSGNGMEVKTL